MVIFNDVEHPNEPNSSAFYYLSSSSYNMKGSHVKLHNRDVNAVVRQEKRGPTIKRGSYLKSGLSSLFAFFSRFVYDVVNRAASRLRSIRSILSFLRVSLSYEDWLIQWL